MQREYFKSQRQTVIDMVVSSVRRGPKTAAQLGTILGKSSGCVLQAVYRNPDKVSYDGKVVSLVLDSTETSNIGSSSEDSSGHQAS